MKRALVALACVTLAGCEIRSTRASVFAFDRDVGVLVQKDNRACVEIGDSTLTNQTIHFVTTGSPQAIHDVRLNARSSACAALFAADPAPHAVYYDAQSVRAPLENGAVALAVATTLHPLVIRDSVLATDLDGDGRTETLRACTSREGLHLTLWAGAPMTGQRVWHRYVYLGYDVEQTCTDAETAPDSTSK